MTVKNKDKLLAKVRKKKEKSKNNDEIFGVVYGPKRESTPIFINKKEFIELYKNAGESTLINLEIKDAKKKAPVLIYDVQEDPYTREIIHVDFLEPNLKEKVEAEIPLEFEGEAPAVKDLDGTLIKNTYSVDVKALPDKLPHEIKVDVSILKTFDDAIYIKDLHVEEGVEILHEGDMTVALVSKPEDVEAELEKPITDEGEPEVVGEKEEEEEEDKESKKEE